MSVSDGGGGGGGGAAADSTMAPSLFILSSKLSVVKQTAKKSCVGVTPLNHKSKVTRTTQHQLLLYTATKQGDSTWEPKVFQPFSILQTFLVLQCHCTKERVGELSNKVPACGKEMEC